jgi:hypothetical protein
MRSKPLPLTRICQEFLKIPSPFGAPCMIAGHLGASARLDQAIAAAYADQTGRY